MPTVNVTPRAVWPRIQFVLAFILLLAFPVSAAAQTPAESTLVAQDLCRTRDATKLGTISGTIRSATDGSPVAKANVIVEDIYGRMMYYNTADNEGKWTIDELSPMDYFVTFSTPYTETTTHYLPEVYDNLDGAGNATIVTVKAAQNVTGIDASLEVGAFIQGKVTNSVDATPIDRVGVSLYTADTFDYLASTFSDEDGSYRFRGGFRPGEYILSFYADGFLDEIYDGAEDFEDATVVTIVGTQGITVDATLDPTGEAGVGTIKGRVTLAGSGDPAAGAYVRPIGVGDTDYYISSKTVDAQGFYTLTVPAGTWRIEVDPSWIYPDYARRNLGGDGTTPHAEVITVAAGATIEGKNVTLSGGWYIEGVITGPGGAPVDDVWIYADEGETYIRNGLDATGRTSEDGTFRVGPLVNTAFTLSIRTSDFDCTLIDKVIVVKPPASPTGTVNLPVQLEQGGLISGRVMSGSPAKGIGSFYVSSISGDLKSYSYTSGTGHYLSDALPAGSYTVAFDNWGYKPQYFDNKPDLKSATKVAVGVGGVVANVNALMVKGSGGGGGGGGGGGQGKIFVPIVMK